MVVTKRKETHYSVKLIIIINVIIIRDVKIFLTFSLFLLGKNHTNMSRRQQHASASAAAVKKEDQEEEEEKENEEETEKATNKEEDEDRDPLYPPLDYSKIFHRNVTDDDLELAARRMHFYRNSPYYIHSKANRDLDEWTRVGRFTKKRNETFESSSS